MKNVTKFALILMALFMIAGASGVKAQADAQGIQFFHGTFAEAQAKAKRENKLIYFNDHFVNLTVDMEKGEGPDLGRRYSVMAYPTLLFLDGNGEVKSRVMGGKPASEFIALGQKAVKAN